MKTVIAEFGNDVTVDLSKVAAVPIDFDFQLHSFNNGNFRVLHYNFTQPSSQTLGPEYAHFHAYIIQSIWVVR